jgi:pimeloyl-ACP methyl ester carboxylesterase
VSAVLLVCGLGQRPDEWPSALIDGLADAGFEVVTFDLPAVPSVDGMASEIAELITDRDLGPCHVVGYSLGAWIAETLAGTRPDLVRSATCIAGLNVTTEWEKVECEYGRDVAAADVPMSRLVGLFEQLVYLPRIELQDDDRVRKLVADALAAPPFENPDRLAQWEAAYRWTRRTDAVGRWSRISVPCLAITYSDDIDSPPAHTRRAADHVPDVKVVELDGTHLTPIESPTETITTLLTFLRSLSPDRRRLLQRWRIAPPTQRTHGGCRRARRPGFGR